MKLEFFNKDTDKFEFIEGDDVADIHRRLPFAIPEVTHLKVVEIKKEYKPITAEELRLATYQHIPSADASSQRSHTFEGTISLEGITVTDKHDSTAK